MLFPSGDQQAVPHQPAGSHQPAMDTNSVFSAILVKDKCCAMIFLIFFQVSVMFSLFALIVIAFKKLSWKDPNIDHI